MRHVASAGKMRQVLKELMTGGHQLSAFFVAERQVLCFRLIDPSDIPPRCHTRHEILLSLDMLMALCLADPSVLAS